MDSIILLNPSDIISESMNTINHNFEVISTYEDVTSYKIDQFTKQYKEDLAELKDLYNSKDLEILDNINSLNDRITNIPSLDNLQDAISSAITESAGSLEAFIQQKAGDYVESRLGDYAKTADIDSAGYITSSAFELYKSNAAEKTASVSLIVGNSRFLKDNNGDFIYVATGESATGISSIEDYYNSLDPDSEEKAYIDGESGDSDSDADKLKDPDVINRLIGKCEEKFKTVTTELASFSQTVSDGVSATAIVNAIQNPDDPSKNVAAAIFMEANKDGSAIVLNADKIQLDGNHKLALNAGTFTINSNKFQVNSDGRITATDLILESTNGKTTIDTEGVLHAHGAVIDGDITAQRFIAVADPKTTTVTEDEITYTGDITKETTITNSEFSIVANGTLSAAGQDPININNNALYISILDEVENTDHNPNFGDKLYGVPALCMRYNGVDYVLNPASWMNQSASSVYDSNMRWLEQFGFLGYTFARKSNTLNGNLTSSLVSGVSGKYYIFKSTNTCMDVSAVKDSICKFHIFDLGSDADTNLGYVKNSPSNVKSLVDISVTSSTPLETINNTGVYALKTDINAVDSGYIGSGVGNRTVISEDTCGLFRDCLTDSILGGVPYSLTLYDENGELTNMLSNLYGFIEYACQGSQWNWYDKDWSITCGASIEGDHITSILPFGDSQGFTNKTFRLELEYYPQISITNYGKTMSTSVNLVWVKCNVYVSATCSNSIDEIPYTLDYARQEPIENYNTGELQPTGMDFTLQFNFALELTGNGIQNFDPHTEEIENKVLNKINSFLSGFNFNSSSNKNNYYTFTASIYDSAHVLSRDGFVNNL